MQRSIFIFVYTLIIILYSGKILVFVELVLSLGVTDFHNKSVGESKLLLDSLNSVNVQSLLSACKLIFEIVNFYFYFSYIELRLNSQCWNDVDSQCGLVPTALFMPTEAKMANGLILNPSSTRIWLQIQLLPYHQRTIRQSTMSHIPIIVQFQGAIIIACNFYVNRYVAVTLKNTKSPLHSTYISANSQMQPLLQIHSFEFF